MSVRHSPTRKAVEKGAEVEAGLGLPKLGTSAPLVADSRQGQILPNFQNVRGMTQGSFSAVSEPIFASKY